MLDKTYHETFKNVGLGSISTSRWIEGHPDLAFASGLMQMNLADDGDLLIHRLNGHLANSGLVGRRHAKKCD